MYTIQPCTSLQRHFIPSYIRWVQVCLAEIATCTFDRAISTAVTRGWNGYRNKSQHRKVTLENKNSTPRSCRDRTRDLFDHESDALTTELSRLQQNEANDQVSRQPALANKDQQMFRRNYYYCFSSVCE